MSHFERCMPISPAGREGYELDVLRPPAELGGTNGLRIGPDGRLWICEALMQRISSCDTKTGELGTVIPRDGSLIAPDDLAIDAEGNAYITDHDRITVRRADGTVSTLTDGLISANGITVDDDGHLYVNEFRPGGRLMEIDRHSGEIRVILESTDFPNACAKGPDGRLYYQNVMAGAVYAVDVDSGETEKIIDGFEMTPSVRFGPNGRLYVAESMRGLVTEIDLVTGVRRIIARMPLGGIDNFEFDAEGALYVSSYMTGCILKVPALDGAEPQILVPPGLVSIAGVAPMSDGSVLVANVFNIPVVAPDGTFDTWSPWITPQHIEMVNGVWPVDADSAFVLTGSGQVLRCQRGQTAADVMTAAAEAPADVVVVSEGAVALGGTDDGVLVGMEGGDVRQISADGTQTLVASTGLGNLVAVTGMTGRIAAADAESNSVAVVENGSVRTMQGFARPTGVAFSAGALYVAEHRARQVVRCDLVTDVREVVASDLPFGWPVPEPPPIGRASLAEAADGSILVGCDGDGSIRRLVRR